MAQVSYSRLGELIDHLVRALAGVNNWRLGQAVSEVAQQTGYAARKRVVSIEGGGLSLAAGAFVSARGDSGRVGANWAGRSRVGSCVGRKYVAGSTLSQRHAVGHSVVGGARDTHDSG